LTSLERLQGAAVLEEKAAEISTFLGESCVLIVETRHSLLLRLLMCRGTLVLYRHDVPHFRPKQNLEARSPPLD
jgi:hypothetical protein